MDEGNLNFFEKLPPEKLKIALIAFLFVGLFVFSVGIGLFWQKGQLNEDSIKIISSDGSGETAGEIVVHVDGAVKSPGIYKLSPEARVNDAVFAAGSFSTEADVAKVNLAAKVTDGQKVYIPRVGESARVFSSGGTVAGDSSTGQINVNTASQAQLEELPGIGPVTAGKIIDLRPYGDVSELLSKKAVNSSVYSKIKDLVTVY